MQNGKPDVAVNAPLAQLAQLGAPALAETLPAGHIKHDDAPAVENVPAVHAEQAVDTAVSDTDKYRPGTQGTQLAAPVANW